MKNSQRDRLSNYMMTIIPDKEYASKFKKFDPQRFAIYGDHVDFSGFIIYSTIASRSIPVQVTRYKSGQKILDLSIFKSETKTSEILAEMSQVLQELQIVQVKSSPITRSFGEDGDILIIVLEAEDVVVLPPPPLKEDPYSGDSNWYTGGDNNGEEPDASETDIGSGGHINESQSGDDISLDKFTTKIFDLKDSNLTKDQIETLNSAAKKLKGNIVSWEICSQLKSKIHIVCDPKLDARINGRYTIKENGDEIIQIRDFNIDNLEYTILEELIHLAQNQFYPNGILQYGREVTYDQKTGMIISEIKHPGYCNIEFEAHIVKALYEIEETRKVTGFGFDNRSLMIDLKMASSIGWSELFTAEDFLPYMDSFINASSGYYESEEVSELKMMKYFTHIINELNK